jgi:GNAT superfamily N-acetyltransferase
MALAEDANTHTPLRPGQDRVTRDLYVVFFGERSDHPAFTVVQRLRLREDDVEETVAELRTLLRDRGRLPCTWEIGTHATPAGLTDQLLGLGLEPFDEPFAVGMVLDEEPPAGPPEIVVRRVSTAEEMAAAHRIARISFGHDDPDAVSLEEAARDLERERDKDSWASFLAFVEGEPVAQAQATFTAHGAVMNGGSTLPEARGRGAYRALVRARWDEARQRGTPSLITQAGGMSRPILERLGFREVCQIQILLDRG